MSEDIGFLIKKIHNAIRADADNNMRAFDLTLSQTRVLTFLVHQERHTVPQKEIETFFCVTHPTMIGILHRLESKGFIAVQVSKADKRMKDVALTEAGEKAAARADGHRRKMEASLTECLTAEEREQLAALLGRVYENLAARCPGEFETWHPTLKEEKT